MIVTEEEAKTKWCPEAPDIPVDVMGDIDPHAATCIASACMAWRWQDHMTFRDTVHGEPTPASKGYCGKAGKP